MDNIILYKVIVILTIVGWGWSMLRRKQKKQVWNPLLRRRMPGALSVALFQVGLESFANRLRFYLLITLIQFLLCGWRSPLRRAEQRATATSASLCDAGTAV
jgi:cbb3-type cytochrome oxidase subunit 3